MATFIKVSSSEEQLLRRNREEVQGNRLQKVEADQQAAAGRDIAASTAQQKLLQQPGGNGRRGVRFKRDEPAAIVNQQTGIGLWKTGETNDDLVNNFFAGWLGVEFTAQSNFTINYLGGFDNFANGLQVEYPIRVWRQEANGDSEILLSTQLPKGNSGWYAGGYRFTEVEPIQIKRGAIIAIVIYYESIDVSSQQEDRYQYSTGEDYAEVAKTNPRLISSVKLAETDDNNSYPNYDPTDGIIASVNVNFAVNITSDVTPGWAQP